MPEVALTLDDRDACAREPIHIPGSIQPHGFLFVLNAADLTIAAASKNAAEAVGVKPMELVGRPIADLLVSSTDENPLNSQSKIKALSRARFRLGTSAAEWDCIVHPGPALMHLELVPRIGDAGIETVLAEVRLAVERIQGSALPEETCATLAMEIRLLTGFDRVMIYRFDADWNGEVVAEHKTPSASSYMGHSFPAADIPAQARELYLRNHVRIIPDASYTPSAVIPDILPSTGQPIDLSPVTLRSVSPVHLEYLRNMGVAASMSVSIVRDGKLWGLTACHNMTPRVLPIAVLHACPLLAQSAVWHLDALERREAVRRIEAAHTLDTEIVAATEDYRSTLHANVGSFLALSGSHGMALCEGQDVLIGGQSPARNEILALSSWLDDTGEDKFVTDRLFQHFPLAERYRAVASGIAATKLPNGWLLWFRPEWPHRRTWAGNPNKPASSTERINPRKSFASWRQLIKGQSRPWTASDLLGVHEAKQLVMRIVIADQMRRLTESEVALIAAKEKAEDANRSKSQTLTNMSHELRTPLNAILGFSEVMLREFFGSLGSPRYREYAANIHESGKHLLLLINDILDLSKIEAGRLELAPESVAASEVFAASLCLVAGQAQTGGIELLSALPDDLPLLHVDRRAILQVLVNLLTNAVKFTPKGGKVELAARRVESGRVEITVTDTGIGIAAKDIAKVLQPFGQADNPNSRRQQGTGLGLPIAKALVERSGGEFQLESEPERGTRVTLRLPVVEMS